MRREPARGCSPGHCNAEERQQSRRAGVLLHKHNARDYRLLMAWAALPGLLAGSGASFATDQAGDAELGQMEGWRDVGLPFPVGQRVSSHRKRWASERLLGPQGEDGIFRKI